ncbi:hypothetical protein EMIT0P43_50112 [Pseudomonas jessenii]
MGSMAGFLNEFVGPGFYCGAFEQIRLLADLIVPQTSGLLCDERIGNGWKPEEHAHVCPVKSAALRP